MDVCFWCRRVKDDNDTEGVPECYDYNPCSRCESIMNKGILIIQTELTHNKNPAIKDGLYPTGKWAVIKESRIRKDFSKWPSLPDVLETKTMYMNEETWKSYGLPD